MGGTTEAFKVIYTLKNKSTHYPKKNIHMDESFKIEKQIMDYLHKEGVQKGGHIKYWIGILVDSMYCAESIYCVDEERYLSLFDSVEPCGFVNCMMFKKNQCDNEMTLSYTVPTNHNVHHINKYFPRKEIISNISEPGKTPWKIPYNNDYYISIMVDNPKAYKRHYIDS